MDEPRIVHALSMDYPWIIHGLSMDCTWIIHGLSMDYPWIIHGISMENEIESGSKVVFESDVVYWALTLSCKTKVIESGGVCGSENGRK